MSVREGRPVYNLQSDRANSNMCPVINVKIIWLHRLYDALRVNFVTREREAPTDEPLPANDGTAGGPPTFAPDNKKRNEDTNLLEALGQSRLGRGAISWSMASRRPALVAGLGGRCIQILRTGAQPPD